MSTTVATSNEWMQFYEQTVDELSASSLGFSDATVVATSVFSKSNLSPRSSSLHSASYRLTPKGSSPKPIRKRSRASKKTPTTLLNANASNFRALVQQFTGCPSTPLSLGNGRGPINLNFTLGSERNQSSSATSLMSASGNDYYYHQQSDQEQLRQQENASHRQHQHLYQEKQHAVSFDDVHQDAFFSSSSVRFNADQILDGFELDHISLPALNRDIPYSNENANDGNYFL
ncbi:uncharacterized protein LOC111308518 [Durio zibethinus]|uniref:Uncharacterized protein LOC111308518 n=1 Tax=Durio zibethinus TaxID=66656 RepID=A0A6P6ACK0_DURZI|nr:uncharacterized protein LOC111308518 [Durio zibethinus]